MWTKRRTIAVNEVPTWPGTSPTITTPAYARQQNDTKARAELTLGEEAFNFVSSLAYTLVPRLTRSDAQALLPWVMARWMPSTTASIAKTDAKEAEDNVAALAGDEEVCAALSQVEFFLAGTDNGHVLVLPMVPSHFLTVVADRYGERVPSLLAQLQREAGTSTTSHVPANCCLKRVLHRHMCEEPVIALDHCGTLVASAASTDTAVAISCFHPRAVPIALIPHERRVRSLKLWEGGPFAAGSSGNHSNSADVDDAEGAVAVRHWQNMLATQEPAAVYVFVGEELDAIVRLYRVDVMHGSFALLHVFVVSQNMTGLGSPLSVLDREDTAKMSTQRETECAIHCLAIDDDKRLLAGLEGGVCVWALTDLPYTATVAPPPRDPLVAETEDTAAPPHPLGNALCWDVAHQRPLVGAMLSSPLPGGAPSALTDPSASAEVGAAVRCVRRRAARLVNQHVWVRDSALLKRELSQTPPPHLTVKKERSKWKAKYARAVAGGVAVGVVSNEVALPAESTATLGEVLASTVVTVSFEGGEVRNDVNLPLSCVQPVVYPLCWLRMGGNACFALEVLQPSGRIVSSGSDGRVAVWYWEPDAEKRATYLPYLVAGRSLGGRRGIGRHVCVMRSPDIFLSCGFDDGIVREWHVYDEPERLLRCERRFTMLPAAGPSSSSAAEAGSGLAGDQLRELAKALTGGGNDKNSEGTTHEKKKDKARSSSSSSSSEDSDKSDDGDGVAGISSAVAFPSFGAVFLVGVFEPTIQTFSLTEVQGCEAPPDYLYNGFKTVKVPAALTSPTEPSL